MFIIEGKDLTNGDLQLDRTQAELEGQVIAIAPSQITDWIYCLRGTTYSEMCQQVVDLKQQIRHSANKKEIKQQIDDLLFITEMVRVKFTSLADFKKYGQGFMLNGVKYVFLLNKGDETITYIKEDLFETLNKKIEGDRCTDYKLVPAKLNAYRSLAMSTSKAVSDCDKVIVVKDCEKTLSGMEYLFVNASELKIEHKKEDVVRNINDGYGLISPRLASVWSKDLGHENTDSAFQVRNLYCKGILATFDFELFATDHQTYEVVDYWGDIRDVRDADIILSESMLKLAGAYSSCEEWLKAVKEHDYKWRVAKTSKKHKYGYTNYQQILPMTLDANDCRELLSDSIQMLKDVSGGDWFATTLYLNGSGASTDKISDYNLAKLIQLEPQLVNDYFIHQKIQANTQKTKNELKAGRTLVNSSFQIIIGDIIAFAQHVLGLDPVGFLGEKEIYSAYHRKNGITEATAFRAPLLCENSIVKVKLNQASDYDKYLIYLDDVYITSSIDLLNESLCGFDYDGDTIQLITAPAIVRNTKSLLPLICQGVSSQKEKCNMGNLFSSCELGVKGARKYNIGSCINKASSMFAARSRFAVDSPEYEELTKRIILSQAISQSYIDYRKSGLAFEMPKHWFNQKAIDLLNIGDQGFNINILADKKPMFMRHIYEEQRAEYNQQLDMLNLKSITLFNTTAKELLATNKEQLTANQLTLVSQFNEISKFNLHDHSTMSIWESQAEQMLKDVRNSKKTKSTGELLKSGANYDQQLEKAVQDLLLDYNNQLDTYGKNLVNVEPDRDRRKAMITSFAAMQKENLLNDVMEVCGNVLVATDVMITVCYKLGKCADLLFELFGEQIYRNVLNRKSYINVIMGDSNGSHSYKYENYSVEKIAI